MRRAEHNYLYLLHNNPRGPISALCLISAYTKYIYIK